MMELLSARASTHVFLVTSHLRRFGGGRHDHQSDTVFRNKRFHRRPGGKEVLLPIGQVNGVDVAYEECGDGFP
jgi:hypothetical protein